MRRNCLGGRLRRDWQRRKQKPPRKLRYFVVSRGGDLSHQACATAHTESGVKELRPAFEESRQFHWLKFVGKSKEGNVFGGVDVIASYKQAVNSAGSKSLAGFSDQDLGDGFTHL